MVAEALEEEAAGLKVQQQAKPRHWELTIASGFLLVLFLLRKTMPNFTAVFHIGQRSLLLKCPSILSPQ